MPKSSETDKAVKKVSHIVWLVTFVRRINLRGIGHIALQLSGVIAVLLVIYVMLGEPGGVDVPVGEGKDVIPATGEQGFNVEVFCEDELTIVRPFPAPDASGVTYQLTRLKSGVFETVIVVMDVANTVRTADHYADGPTGQAKQPAFITDNARECINDKS